MIAGTATVAARTFDPESLRSYLRNISTMVVDISLIRYRSYDISSLKSIGACCSTTPAGCRGS